MTEDDLSAILARWEKTTPGPWVSFLEARDDYSGEDFIRTGGNDMYVANGTPDDQEFVAHAKQDVPRLVEEVRRLRTLLGAVANKQ